MTETTYFVILDTKTGELYKKPGAYDEMQYSTEQNADAEIAKLNKKTGDSQRFAWVMVQY